MTTKMMSDGWNDLVSELQQLEDYFPMLGVEDEHEELQEEVRELEQLIAAAGVPEDTHSMQALTFLQTELARKREMLDW